MRLRRAVEGNVHFDAFSRGLYSTDASIYQMMPIGVVVPRTFADVEVVLDIARDHGVPVLPRGGGTSQCGQTVNNALVIDFSRHLSKVIHVDRETETAIVEPGLVLDRLNALLAPDGLWFPVDISTASRAIAPKSSLVRACGSIRWILTLIPRATLLCSTWVVRPS